MSTIVPANSIDTSSGSAVTAATTAVRLASPVVSRTSHGNATIVMPLAVPERTAVVSRTTNGRQERAVLVDEGRGVMGIRSVSGA